MQSLDKIKRRIKSVQTTSKITGAMKLVATAKMKKLMTQFKMVNAFCQDFYTIIEDLVKTVPISIQEKKNASKSRLWILVSSSLGLCGAFNINVCKFLMTMIKPNDKVLVIGRKGYSYLKSHGHESLVIGHLDFSNTEIDYLSMLPACENVIEQFNGGTYSSVHLVYTKFINSLTFNPIEIQLLPFDSSLFKSDNQKPSLVDLSPDKKEIDYEPSKEDILKSSLTIFFATSLFAAISESRVCENGARRNAMETATDNARELIDDLTLEFNDARQQNITQEINEIVAGADGSAV